MLNKKMLISAVFLIIISIISLVILQGQSNQPINPSNSTSKISDDSCLKIRDTFPVVEYTDQSSLKGEFEEERKMKSRKYDYIQILNPETIQDYQEHSSIDWAVGLPALPIEKSQVIIVGKLVDTKAHLSSQKKSVYSEFKIEVEKVYKNTSQNEFESGKYLVSEREGGVVRFSSGHKAWYSLAGQQMPKVGSQYLFFLTNEFPRFGYQKQGLFLLTAYEFKDGQVFPLDNPDGGMHPIAKMYKGKEQSILLNDLEKALTLK
jgi:hypothetical protein